MAAPLVGLAARLATKKIVDKYMSKLNNPMSIGKRNKITLQMGKELEKISGKTPQVLKAKSPKKQK